MPAYLFAFCQVCARLHTCTDLVVFCDTLLLRCQFCMHFTCTIALIQLKIGKKQQVHTQATTKNVYHHPEPRFFNVFVCLNSLPVNCSPPSHTHLPHTTYDRHKYSYYVNLKYKYTYIHVCVCCLWIIIDRGAKLTKKKYTDEKNVNKGFRNA